MEFDKSVAPGEQLTASWHGRVFYDAVIKQEAVAKRIARHHAFWERNPQDRPLVSFQLNDYFVSNRMHASANLRIDKKKIEPGMLEVDRFLDD